LDEFAVATALEVFINSMLWLQADFQMKPPPTHHKESSNNRQFVSFVHLCARAADSELANHSEKIEQALKNVTKRLGGARDNDRAKWDAMWKTDPASSE
jgi:hypothetical protein